jgi:hypothetical protein
MQKSFLFLDSAFRLLTLNFRLARGAEPVQSCRRNKAGQNPGRKFFARKQESALTFAA